MFGIEKYLGSGLIKGVGPKFAGRIVKTFGEATLTVIEETPERLLEVEGIGRLRVERIKKSWQEQKEIKNIMLFLQSHDVSTAHATKIFKTYGNESVKIVQENPYRLADDIWGIGFRTADTIAGKMGFDREKYVRLRSGILYTLNKLAESGHCFATRDMLLKTGAELLSVGEDVLSVTLDEMVRAHDVITDYLPEDKLPGKEITEKETAKKETAKKETAKKETAKKETAKKETAEKEAAERETAGKDITSEGAQASEHPGTDLPASGFPERIISGAAKPGLSQRAIYLPPFFFSETGTARRLKAIFADRGGIRVREQGLLERIRQKTGMTYDEVQLEAILTAVKSKVFILTGGPGTGKTTTTLGIITAFREAGAGILLAAPTGRAAKRLSEATGMEAKTLHRLLEVKPPDGYQRNEENPLTGDVLIVDECSMIDVMLRYNLLKAVPDSMRVILVGDVDQLPSVGAGNVLRDIIDSDRFPVVRLTRIFRQAMKSRIILNAHRINAGQLPDLSNGKNSDFFFVDAEKLALKKGRDPKDNTVLAEETAAEIVGLVKTKLPRYYRVPAEDIQVLSPLQKGVTGAANLNQLLQQALNPGDFGLRKGGFLFKPHDRVMQIRNNYDKEVFNGDIGVIESVNTEDRELTAVFDGRPVTYDVSELDELVLAYAATIHKSQGSEYPIVVMPVLMNHYVMLQRNLVYTGITRAKKVLVLVGTKKAAAYAVRNVTVDKRNTLLKERL